MTIDALRLEVKKDKWEQLQNGTYKLQVTVNPADLNDNSDEILLQFIKAGMGERFMMGVAKIGPDEQAEPVQKGGLSQTQADGKYTPKSEYAEPPRERKQWSDMPKSQQAAIRCDDPVWRKWAQDQTAATYTFAKDTAVNWLYLKLSIESRKQLDINPEKGAAWDRLDGQFIEDTRLPERH